MVFKSEAPVKGEFCEAVGKKLAIVRRAQGLSQKKLAGKVGISQQLISRIESGGENASLMTLAKIARAFNKKVAIEFVA